jgi:arylsulfatase A-like enzyme
MHYEGLLRVGLIARGPGVPAAKAVADPVSTLDLPATFADYAGIDGAWARHSRSLRPLIEGEGRREFAFNEWHLLPARTGIELQLRTVRARSAKLTVDLITGAGELYDLTNDPFEMENRFDAGGGLTSELMDMLMSRPADERPPQAQTGAA